MNTVEYSGGPKGEEIPSLINLESLLAEFVHLTIPQLTAPSPPPPHSPTFLLKTSTLFDVFLIPFVISWAKLNCGSPSQKAQT